MSRSFKKQPFMAICGNGSAKQDKIQAHRGERAAHKRTINKAIKNQDYDILLPHRRECHWNNVYCWGRDGNQMYWSPDNYFGKEWFVRMMRK